MMYRGLDAATGGPITDIEHIRQSIADILATPIGSRIMRRSYGSLLPELIDQPLNGTTLLRITAATYSALLRWEPRVRVTRARFAPDSSHPGRLVADIDLVRTDQPGAGRLALSVPITLA